MTINANCLNNVNIDNFVVQIEVTSANQTRFVYLSFLTCPERGKFNLEKPQTLTKLGQVISGLLRWGKNRYISPTRG